MISGELDFDDRMYNENTKAYYNVSFLVYILFTLIMTVFVTNLLIGKMCRREGERVHLIHVYFQMLCDLLDTANEFLSE